MDWTEADLTQNKGINKMNHEIKALKEVVSGMNREMKAMRDVNQALKDMVDSMSKAINGMQQSFIKNDLAHRVAELEKKG